jgi:copper oxidase (laccase) domain-containing protein
MTQLGAHPSDLQAALGPSIGLCCFEVDSDLADRFSQYLARYFTGEEAESQSDSVGEGSAAQPRREHGFIRQGRPGKAYLDLRAILTNQLQQAGLQPANVTQIGPCTRCAHDRFFSRRAASGQTTGLQLSFVGFAD